MSLSAHEEATVANHGAYAVALLSRMRRGTFRFVPERASRRSGCSWRTTPPAGDAGRGTCRDGGQCEPRLAVTGKRDERGSRGRAHDGGEHDGHRRSAHGEAVHEPSRQQPGWESVVPLQSPRAGSNELPTDGSLQCARRTRCTTLPRVHAAPPHVRTALVQEHALVKFSRSTRRQERTVRPFVATVHIFIRPAPLCIRRRPCTSDPFQPPPHRPQSSPLPPQSSSVRPRAAPRTAPDPPRPARTPSGPPRDPPRRAQARTGRARDPIGRPRNALRRARNPSRRARTTSRRAEDASRRAHV